MTAAITAEALVKRYPARRGAGPVEALAGLSFEVDSGTVFGMLGPNGAGKSTTMRILTTLALPTAGRARVAGSDVVREAANVRASIGYVPQGSAGDPILTARENLVLAGRLRGMREPGTRAAELLAEFGLAEAADRRFGSLSGGQRRRIDVAIALMHRPAVLFLDEPTNGLDPESRSAMWVEIRRLAADGGLTVVLTTHYLEEADRLADRLMIVDGGRKVAEGTPAALKTATGAATLDEVYRHHVGRTFDSEGAAA